MACCSEAVGFDVAEGSIAQTINPAGTTTLAINPSEHLYSDRVTLTPAVTTLSLNSESPNGSVGFELKENGSWTEVASATLSSETVNEDVQVARAAGTAEYRSGKARSNKRSERAL